MKYLAVAGRQPLISLAEIQALYDKHAKLVGKNLIIFQLNNKKPEINRLGGIMKLGELFEGDFKGLVKHLNELHLEGKITFGNRTSCPISNPSLLRKLAYSRLLPHVLCGGCGCSDRMSERIKDLF